MNHKQFKEWLQLSFVDEITDEENGLLREHLAKCEECRADFHELQRLMTHLGESGAKEPSEQLLWAARQNLREAIRRDSLTESILTRLTQGVAPAGSGPRGRSTISPGSRGGWMGWFGGFRSALSGAAAIAIGVFIGYLAFAGGTTPPAPYEAGGISVDDKMTGEIQAGTSGGDISIDDLDGMCELATSGGDISARTVTGDAEIATSGGDIEIDEVKGTLDVATSGGDIEVGNVGKDVSAKTAGGDIIIGDVGGDADLATAGGDVEVGRINGTAELRTAGGDIEVQSATGEVSAQTAGGDIMLSEIKGSVEAETAGGDIEVDLTPTGKRGSILETKGGDIVLYIPANAKVTIEAEIRLHYGRWQDYDDYDEYDIMSDFKAESKDKDKRGIRAKYVLNGGGPRIELETMHGDIEIRKSR